MSYRERLDSTLPANPNPPAPIPMDFSTREAIFRRVTRPATSTHRQEYPPGYAPMQTLALTCHFARSSFLTMLAHRLRYLIGVFNYLVYATVAWHLWQAIFEHQGPLIARWTLPEMQTYVCVNWILRSTYFSNSDSALAGRISKGEIASDLLRPSSLLTQFYGMALGETLFRFLFMGLPVGLLILHLYGIAPPASPLAAAGFLYSALLAFHLFFALNFLTGLCGVFTEKLMGFLWAKFILLQFLSGQLLPLEFFPPAARLVMEWLPFKGIAHTPMSIYLGRLEPGEMAAALLLQTLWTLALLAACEGGWRLVRRRLSILGG